MGKIPCLDCNEPFEVHLGIELNEAVACTACGSDFVIVAVEPLEIEWSYEDYIDYDYDENEWDDDDNDEEDGEDKWDDEEWSMEVWNQQFAKKRVSQQNKELSVSKQGQKQPRYQDAG